MVSDKELKKDFKKKASLDPDNYYATKVLRSEGYMRKQCGCGTFYWTVNADQQVCGDPACSGGFRFIGDTPAKKEMDYVTVWKEFSELFTRLGYTPIPRYPVVARWRDDTDFVQASIYDFQPYVVSGEVKPPANPLVVPQFCLRFNDIDNVGITGAHYTGFVMIGQHMFVPKAEWDQDKVFRDIYTWLREGLGLPKEEITFHEDAWAGGGNFGPSMEYFSRGLELGNQVYMLYDQTPTGPKELKLKVLDMGMGQERNAWFTKGTSTSYDAVFPTVMKNLYSITGIDVDQELMQKFLPYSSYLNIDEVDDIEQTWKEVAEKVGIPVDELKSKIIPLSALYSIAEHSRSLLFALSDGALPSNVGGGYNLRIILRRALSFIDKYGWDIKLIDVCRWHAEYLKSIFPELSENLDEVGKILEVENKKYEATKEKSRQVIQRIIQTDISEENLLELYDCQGISPEIIKEEAQKLGKTIVVPEDFYSKVAELHEKREQEHATKKEEDLDIPEDVPETKIEYYDDWKKLEHEAEVVFVSGENVILDSTIGYPTSGGQLHDLGRIEGHEIYDIYKQGSYIVHVVKDHELKKGDKVKIEIDWKRRKQLTQHHTGTHIVNAAARKVLGKHINQAGAKKTLDKAHLDITHFENITDAQLKEIEDTANSIVEGDYDVISEILPRGEAEEKYGMAIYQGGAVPGKHIRIIKIDELDTEACGGTHLQKTSDVGCIRMIKSTKIQDGVVRLTYTAGKAADALAEQKDTLLDEAARLLGVDKNQVPGRAQELFSKWKTVKKKRKKGKEVTGDDLKLTSTEEYEGDALEKTAEILKTQPEHIVNTIRRFLNELQ